jgi:eukaryotic-like serine/threonine-protein kinase
MDELFLRLQTALAGEYSIERELGRGGMGVVYLAREVRLARAVAIKVLPPALAESRAMREQFLREAQIAARLSHPNIVPIHRVDEAGGFVYFVMAFVNGQTLAERVRERGPLPPHQAARVLREVAWALTYAHSNGIVHRDVKAENILIEHGTERALVTDFGIAGAVHGDARTDAGLVAGSAHYASPEQIAGEPIAAPSDLYSLGVTGFLALTGRLPFDAPTSREVVAMHLNTRAPAVASFAPAVPVKLAQIVERCLAKRPEHRYSSAAAFAEAIDQAVEPPREIPAAIRVWLNKTNTNERTTIEIVLGLILTSLCVFPLALGMHRPLLATVVGATAFISTAILPSVLRMQRLINAGYGIDDLRVAIREYWTRRREEVVYDLAPPGHGVGRRTSMRLVIGGAAVAAVSSAYLTTGGLPIALLTGFSASTAIGALLLSTAEWSQLRQVQRLGERQIKFFESKWGERFIRLASFGKRNKPSQSTLPQLTEVALGRATDALYDALPKDLRKQLKSLPDTVHRLEHDAKSLRGEIDKLDTSIGQLDGDARGTVPSAIADSPHEARIRAERDRLRTDLRGLREQASDRLAATVAALENIRLDLLRLQLGDGRVESVTASLTAARAIAGDLHAIADASREVDALIDNRYSTPAGGL